MSSSPEPSRDAVQEVELELHGVVYTVSVAVHGDELLVVKIEDSDSLDAWHGEFAAKYVEDITSKTGSFKKFGVFVRMLQSAVLQQSDSVFVDLLTCADLEMLKAKKAAAAAASSSDATQQQQQPPALRQLPPSLASKRYLILTYASEFDRVHYPLPLLADQQPDPGRFRAVIASLRQQLAAVQAGLSAQQGGQQHQHQQLAGRQQRSRSSQPAVGEQLDAVLLASRLEVVQAELEGERAAHRRELRKKVREIQELQEEVIRGRDVSRELRQRIKSLEADLQAARASMANNATSSSRGGVAAATAAAAARPGSKPSGYRRPAAADRYSYGNNASTSYLAGSSKFPSRPANYSSSVGGSRNTSCGSSPASSRGQSPSSTRPWAQNSPAGPSSRPPRPSSAPPKQRFDPTEYVRQKREREQQRLAARRSSSTNSRGDRAGSPASSVRSRGGGGGGGGGLHSGASTPRSALSAASSSFGRGAGAAGQLQPRHMAAREDAMLRGSGGSLCRQPGGGGGGRPSSVGRQQQQQRPGSSSSRDQLGATYGVGAAAGGAGGSRSSSRQRLDRLPDRDTASGRDGPGAASPGRALQGVRDKLDAYYAKQQRLHAGVVHTTTHAASSPLYKLAAAPAKQPPPLASPASKAGPNNTINSGGGVLHDASSEIADIDQRLHALQTFLKMAKSSVKGAA